MQMPTRSCTDKGRRCSRCCVASPQSIIHQSRLCVVCRASEVTLRWRVGTPEDVPRKVSLNMPHYAAGVPACQCSAHRWHLASRVVDEAVAAAKTEQLHAGEAGVMFVGFCRDITVTMGMLRQMYG